MNNNVLFVLLVILATAIVISYYKINELKRFLHSIRNKLKAIERSRSKEKTKNLKPARKYRKRKTVKPNSYKTARKKSKRGKNSELTSSFFGETVGKGRIITCRPANKKYIIVDKKHVKLYNSKTKKGDGEKLTLSRVTSVLFGNNGNHGLGYWMDENGVLLSDLKGKYYKG